MPTLEYAGSGSSAAIAISQVDIAVPSTALEAAEVVVPSRLDAAARQRLEDELYDVQRRIFRGVDKASFVSYVIDSKAEHTWIQLYRAAGGALGGYLAVHIYERVVGGRKIAVVRAETGVLREHRGANIVFRFMADRVLRYRLAHPRRPLYLLAAFVHPSSYAQTVRYTDEVWPREGAQTPAEILALMNELGESFGLQRVAPENPLVRAVGWQTIDSRRDRAYWERSERPGVQFFLGQNPGYGEGHGLLTLAPITLGAVVRGVARYLSAVVRRRRARIAGALPAGTAS